MSTPTHQSDRGRPNRGLPSLSFVLCLLASILSSTPTQAAQSSLVAAYSFDEGAGTTVADASGNNNTGTLVGATWSGSGKFNGALSFNGTSSRVDVPNAPSLQLSTAMTLEAWVNPSVVTGSWRDVIMKGKDNYFLAATSSSAKPVGAGTLGGVNTKAIGTTPLATGTWTHLTATYDGTALKLYVNGILVKTTAVTGTIATSTSPLQFGGDTIWGRQYFTGRIDEIRIYDTALTQAEIQTDMTTAIG